MECIFCKIIAGQTESSIVYEDDSVLAFMNIRPIHSGEVLVIPKQHIDHFSDIADDLASKIFFRAHKISQAVRREFNPERVGLVVHGYGVPHAHMIVVPMYHEDDITSGLMAEMEDGKIVFNEKNIPLASREELNDIAGRLRSKI